MDARASRDVDTIVSLLVEEATVSMPPHPHWFDGRDAVIEALISSGKPRVRYVIGLPSRQLATGWSLWDPQTAKYAAASLEVLALEGTRVRQITAFVVPGLVPGFGMPPTLRALGRD